MAVFFLLLCFSLALHFIGLTDFSAFFSHDLQNFCQSLLPDSKFKWAYAAMVCGFNLPAGSLKSDLQQTGLLHLFVVSGSHLVFLSVLLEFIFRRNSMRPVIALSLISYALLTGFNPPVVRSLFSIGARWLNKKYKFFWSSFDEALFAGAICLCLLPAWWGSLSFLLSWLASLGLLIGRNHLQQALYIYALLLLPLAGLGLSDPFSVILNWLVAPVLGLTLFPLCLLTILCPPLTHFVDILWMVVMRALDLFARWMIPTQIMGFTPKALSWLLLFTLQFYFTYSQSQKRRKDLTL